MTDTLTKGWELVEDNIDDALLIAWDGCHKIYLALDDIEAAWFIENYEHTYTGTSDEKLSMLHKWFEESCWLRFISGVRHNSEDPNAGFVRLIEQGAGDENDDSDDDDSEGEW